MDKDDLITQWIEAKAVEDYTGFSLDDLKAGVRTGKWRAFLTAHKGDGTVYHMASFQVWDTHHAALSAAYQSIKALAGQYVPTNPN
jgi:hypothetical protein